jgi:hypothetical protein
MNQRDLCFQGVRNLDANLGSSLRKRAIVYCN